MISPREWRGVGLGQNPGKASTIRKVVLVRFLLKKMLEMTSPIFHTEKSLETTLGEV